jgi:hypothetical protein
MDFSTLHTTIKAQLHERANNPLLGSFFISWIICNYKFITILFSSAELKEKLNLIETIAFSTTLTELNIFDYKFLIPHYVTNGVIYPLIMSLAYIIIFPWPSMAVLRVHGIIRNISKKIQLINDSETPISNKEVQDRTNSYLAEIDAQKTREEKLAKEVIELKNKLDVHENNENEILKQSLIIANNNKQIREMNGKLKGLHQELHLLDNMRIESEYIFDTPEGNLFEKNNSTELIMNGETEREVLFLLATLHHLHNPSSRELILAVNNFIPNLFAIRYFIEKAYYQECISITVVANDESIQEKVLSLTTTGMSLLTKPANMKAFSAIRDIVKITLNEVEK